MKKAQVLMLACLIAVPAFAQQSEQTEDLSESLKGEPEILGLHWARGGAVSGRAAQARASNPLMTYHGGKIMTTAVMKAIFWGPSWSSATFAGDKITGLDTWYTGFSGSNYAKTVNEYTGLGKTVGSTTTYQGHVVDTTAAVGGGSSSAILAEVCKMITPDPSGNGYYPVYTDVKRGSAGYCAWHSSGSCKNVPVHSRFSSIWTETAAATRPTPAASIRRDWPRWRT